jgi:hypothetical protein
MNPLKNEWNVTAGRNGGERRFNIFSSSLHPVDAFKLASVKIVGASESSCFFPTDHRGNTVN